MTAAYWQLAGVLAGFAFVALASYLITGPGGSVATRSRADRSGAARSLFSTFAALVLVAVLYALLTGEPDGSPRANLGVLVTGVPFGLAIITMFYSLTQMAAARGLYDLARTGRFLVVFIGPVVVFSRLNNGVFVVSRGTSSPWPPYRTGWVLLVLVAVLSFICAALGRRFPRWRFGETISAHACLVTGVLAAGIAAYLAAKPASYNLSEGALHATVALMAVVMVGFSVAAASAISAELSRARSAVTSGQMHLFDVA
nr:hypothetical protein GCM10017745_35630 [Saccharothrix mutabilis subsp. capreolus]